MPPTSASTSEPHRGILPKKCRYCDRRFSKAEHLKRHQRSHTGERPYTCPRCNKSFSRSDVLIRHLKNHPQIIGEEVEKSSSEGDFIEVGGQPHSKLRRGTSSSVHQPQFQNAPPPPEQLQPPCLIDPALEDHPAPTHHGLSSGLDHLALLASQQKWGNGTMDSVMAAGNGTLPEIGVSPSWALGMTPQTSHDDVNFDPRRASVPYQNMGPSPAASRFNYGEDFYGRMNGMHDQMTSDMGMGHDTAIMPHDLQNWFDQFDMESQLPTAASMQDVRSPTENKPPAAKRSPSVVSEPQSIRNSASPSTIIPTERFAKVEKCWPNRHSNPLRVMPTLWWDLASKEDDNLFSNGKLSAEAMAQNRQCGSRWGLDEDCRERLQRMFVIVSQNHMEHNAGAFGSPDNLSTPSESRSAGAPSVTHDMSITSSFPPAEIFDIGLDLYFRQFHPLLPYIHTPTFCPKTAPTSVLFVMCLVGLTILQTKGATAFVRQTFSKALEQVSNEMMPGPQGEGTGIDQFSSLASAHLILNLTEMTGQKHHQAQCQMLYTNVITTAQKNGLFNSDHGQPLNDAFFNQISDLESRWRAWGRIESAKRLILCLVMVDTWYSATLHTSPIMSTTDISLILPCSSALFSATSAQKWSQLLSKGEQISMPTISLTTSILTLPSLPRNLESLSMNGILALIRLCISHNFHRLLSGTHHRAVEQSFIPCQIYASDPLAKSTPSFVTQIMSTYSDLFTTMNPNCLALWHNMNIMLTADIRLFEIGAGCAGATPAIQALDDIAIWSQTSAARRAVVHAAQTFKLMSNRRASDGDPFHASTGLFISALILGLYVFMVPLSSISQESNTASIFDLGDDVDWVSVGSAGFGLDFEQQNQTGNPATNFILNGGGICFDGVVHRPGYEAARRILLDHARLLEDIGRWKVRVNQYSKVLRIMSDALVDVENGL